MAANDVDALLDLDAIAQAEHVRAGDVTPVELVEASMRRIEATDGIVNAVIHRRFDRALSEAAMTKPGTAAFAGVPTVVKDLGLQMAGEPYHGGVQALKDAGNVATIDTYTYQKLRAAGFVVLGRTNTPELGLTITTEPTSHGACRNPWNPDHSTGGSSGGSAAAVAAGMVSVAHATDGGGSIRVPASECGLVGLKPTRGRISRGPTVGESWMGASIENSVTRTVRDTAAVLDALHGPMPGDPYGTPTPTRSFLSEVGADPGVLRIGWTTRARDTFTVDPECVDAVHAATALLDGLGHRTVEAAPARMFEDEFAARFGSIVAANVAVDVRWIEATIGRPLVPGDVEADTALLAEWGATVGAPDYLESVAWMHRYQRSIGQWWAPAEQGGDGFDLLVSPTIAMVPPAIGWLRTPDARLSAQRLRMLMQYTSQFNVTGQPAISLPLHWSADGLPVGVQIVAAFGREDLLLRVAAQLEAAAPWAHRRAPIYGRRAA